ncbi:hypothetical protein [Moritella yayanosii]|uniref:hypothetical protein n=1 Tax=Moritella yayanosii TaxID=69539 RepID=UPI001E3ED84E|nr:hypothetical protein [Moritella yayanosii]
MPESLNILDKPRPEVTLEMEALIQKSTIKCLISKFMPYKIGIKKRSHVDTDLPC